MLILFLRNRHVRRPKIPVRRGHGYAPDIPGGIEFNSKLVLAGINEDNFCCRGFPGQVYVQNDSIFKLQGSVDVDESPVQIHGNRLAGVSKAFALKFDEHVSGDARAASRGEAVFAAMNHGPKHTTATANAARTVAATAAARPRAF